jgi:hypothetical protein
MDEKNTKNTANIAVIVTGIVAVFAILIMAIALSPMRNNDGVTGKATSTWTPTKVILTDDIIKCSNGAVACSVVGDSCGAGATCIRTNGEYCCSGKSTGGSGSLTDGSNSETGTETTTLTTTNMIKVEQMKGEGISYACFDSQGYLFRTNTPCEQMNGLLQAQKDNYYATNGMGIAPPITPEETCVGCGSFCQAACYDAYLACVELGVNNPNPESCNPDFTNCLNGCAIMGTAFSW